MASFTTPEAQELQQAQRNQSRYTAFIVAILLHVAIAFILGIVYFAGGEPKQPSLIIQAPMGNVQEQTQMKDLSNLMKETPSSSSSQMSKLITSASASPIHVPEMPEIEVDTIEMGAGFGDGFGAGMGGSGLGAGGLLPPESPLRDRCSKQDREKRLLEGGGTAETEAAVVKGLDWLKSTQKEDGSWGSDHPVAMTGLAVLAYLGHCETPDSREYGESVSKGIVYLIDSGVANSGALRSKIDQHWPYEHGIGTYALCEAFSLLKYSSRKQPYMDQLKEVVTLAVPIIIEGQNPDGGWVYNYTKENPGDTSVASWQMQALKAASLTGIEFKNLRRSTDDGVNYMRSVQGPEGGFGYRERGDKFSLAGVGALSQQIFGKSHGSIRRAIRFILSHKFDYDGPDASLYGWYYGTQACFQEGSTSREWAQWNEMFREPMVAAQQESGAWRAEGGTGGADSSGAAGSDAEHYRTCLSILMLEVYYRYLPSTK